MLHGRHFGLVNREIQEFGHKSVLTGGRVKCEIEEYGHLYCPMSYGNFNPRLSSKLPGALRCSRETSSASRLGQPGSEQPTSHQATPWQEA